MSKECGNPDCKVSSGIHEHDSYPGLTFGSGGLDDYGYWDKPCAVCARANEKNHPENGPCWPFKAPEGIVQVLKSMTQSIRRSNALHH